MNKMVISSLVARNISPASVSAALSSTSSQLSLGQVTVVGGSKSYFAAIASHHYHHPPSSISPSGLSSSSSSALSTSQLTPASVFQGRLIIKRNLHLSSCRSNPRFRLELERTPPVSDGPEEHGGGEEESYLKSHSYRQLCPWKSKSELANVLVQNQIYNEHGLFVTNKPFGVGVLNPPGHRKGHYADSQQLHTRGLQISPYTLEDAVPDLRRLLNMPKLVVAKSTERMSSGLAVFAENDETRERFSKALKSSKAYYDMMYKYHVVTVLPPLIIDPHPHRYERLGVIIKTPVGSDRGQPVLIREFSRSAVDRQDVKPIRVLNQVLKAGYNEGFLMEVSTSGVNNNFLRIYCAEKLAPLLGDHLYWNRVRLLKGIPTRIDPTHLAPGTSAQKLSEKTVDLLQLKSYEDTVIIPAHVHLRSYKLRKFLVGNKTAEMEFEAPYPPYFKWTCDQFGISLYEEPV